MAQPQFRLSPFPLSELPKVCPNFKEPPYIRLLGSIPIFSHYITIYRWLSSILMVKSWFLNHDVLHSATICSKNYAKTAPFSTSRRWSFPSLPPVPSPTVAGVGKLVVGQTSMPLWTHTKCAICSGRRLAGWYFLCFPSFLINCLPTWFPHVFVVKSHDYEP